MTDQILFELTPGWALGADHRQWVLGRTDITPLEGKKPVSGARLRPRAFIASEKAVLRRCINENGIEPTPEATRFLDALPPTFKQWCRKQKSQKAKSTTKLHLNLAAE